MLNARQAKPFTSVALTVKDEFAEIPWRTKTVAWSRPCLPVRKNNDPLVRDQRDHLLCYAIEPKPQFKPRSVAINNQFKKATLRVLAPDSLCVPTRKRVIP